MDGMAKRERTAAGDELSEEFGGVGSAGLNRVASREPGSLDRLERNSAAEESSIGGQQQPVSDRTEREGEMLGVLGAGARGEALGAGLGASLRLSTGIDGDLRGARPLWHLSIILCFEGVDRMRS